MKHYPLFKYLRSVVLPCGLIPLALLSACSSPPVAQSRTSSTPTVSAQKGEVFGTLEISHTAPARPSGVKGKVIFMSAAGQETQVLTNNAGHYSINLNDGTYRITGSTPSFDNGKDSCVASLHGQLQVTSNSRSEVFVVCDPSNLQTVL